MLKPRPRFQWHARSFRIDLGMQTCIMGIVNVTADSFSGDGALSKNPREKIPGLSHALRLIDQGADILDIGGESSRPGARTIPAEEEIRRVIPLIKALAARVKIPLSIDTFKPSVAHQALDAGVSIVNLIKGTPPSPALLKMVKDAKAGIILMHMRGTPGNMQSRTSYKDIINDIQHALKDALDVCKACGIKQNNIVIDPGIGFAKTASQNLLLLRHLNRFSGLKKPLLIGTSRKSFIGKILGDEKNQRLLGTLATTALSAATGAHIVRVHDVAAIKQTTTMIDAIMASS